MRPGFLWLAGFRDLQWRRRRFVIAVLGSSLVFALTLMLAGFLGIGMGGFIGSIISATVGAVILLVIVRLIKKA